MAKLHFVVERGHGTSTSMSPEWCGGARRPAWHLERGCPRTPWRIFDNISIRRKPAATSVAWVASGRRLRSTSGAPSGAFLTPHVRRRRHERFRKLNRSARASQVKKLGRVPCLATLNSPAARAGERDRL